LVDTSDPKLQESFLLDIKKAKESIENAKGKMVSTASKMFQFYANLFSAEAKYMWNKIVSEKTVSNP
jgi:hypothetical protein